ncbi:MAG: hypothetical protein EXS03_09710 [Phycisphaerales bacterium]|nr:hypothetical protein [Phycisphaerales bacterium]
MLKILSGQYRSRQLQIPEGDETRPMGARPKAAIFNLLRGWFEDANVLDLYAGVGTMGLEAASQGAKRVVCIEQNRYIADFLRANILTLGCADRVQAVQTDALGPGAVAAAPAPVTVAFVDPPFELMREDDGRQRVLDQIAALRRVMAPKSFVVLRTPEAPDGARYHIAGFDGPEAHGYGAEQHVLLYAPSPE